MKIAKQDIFFWQEINRVFFNSRYIVKSSEGIADLYKKVEKIDFDKSKRKYLLCVDCSMDNANVRNYIMKLRKLCMKYNNKLFIEGSYYGGGQSGVSWSGDTTGEWPANTGTNPDKFGYRFLKVAKHIKSMFSHF